MADYDAIAIGGGLAGAAFARELARGGARVAIVERTSGPQLKVCGDFLSIEAQQLLHHLGVDIARLGASRIETLRLVTGGASATAPLPFAAAGLSRLRLDETLLAAAADAGAELIRGEAVTALEPGEGGATVRIGRRALRTEIVGLATGKHNLRGWPRKQTGPTAYKMSYALAPSAADALTGAVQLLSYPGGYVGACLIENGLATICWLADRSMTKTVGANWPDHIRYFSSQSARFGDLMSGARPLSARPAAVSSIPFGYVRRTDVPDMVFPLGDQIAVIPSFTGDGTSLALSSGIVAARAVLAGQSARAYQRDFLAGIRRQFMFAGVADLAFANRITRKLSVGAVAAAPRLATLIARLTRLRDVESAVTPVSSSLYNSSSTK
jgi:flavin-dependent dehydrogenase